jgi:AraC family transcriptional regulator of adaptative response / DNA-3-methyladenine glycosylase II
MRIKDKFGSDGINGTAGEFADAGRECVRKKLSTAPEFMAVRPLTSRMRVRSRSRLSDGTAVYLPFKSPYDWHSIIGFFRSHSIPGLERVTVDSFTRLFRLGNTIGAVQVQAAAGIQRLQVRVVPGNPEFRLEAVRRIKQMFDLDCDPRVIGKSLCRARLLERLYRRYPGLRLARGWDAFETATCSILGQLVSADHRATLIGQLVRNYGEEIADPITAERAYLFPRAEVLAGSDLSAVKTTSARREAIREFSRRVLSGAISFSDGQDPAALRRAILETKGLGPWSAEYISMRATGDTDAFPKTDLILKRVLALHPDLDLEVVKPWRSYAAIYLWKEFAQTLSRNKNEKPA